MIADEYFEQFKKDILSIKDIKYIDCVDSLWCTQLGDLKDCIQLIVNNQNFKDFDERFINFFENFFETKHELLDWSEDDEEPEEDDIQYVFGVQGGKAKWKFYMQNGKIIVNLGSETNADYWLDNFEVLNEDGYFGENIKSFDDAVQYMSNVKKIKILQTKDIYADRECVDCKYSKYCVDSNIEYAYEIKSDDSYYYIFKLQTENWVSAIRTDKHINIKKLDYFLMMQGRFNFDTDMA